MLLPFFVSPLPHQQNFPFKDFFHPGKQKKSFGEGEGEYGGWDMRVMPSFIYMRTPTSMDPGSTFPLLKSLLKSLGTFPSWIVFEKSQNYKHAIPLPPWPLWPLVPVGFFL